MMAKNCYRNRVTRISRKYKLIKLAGGSCCNCGYNKNISALVFHHFDNKTQGLNGHTLSSVSIKTLTEEIKNCVLLCHNCHNELHNPLLTMANVGKICQALDSKTMTCSEAGKRFLK